MAIKRMDNLGLLSMAELGWQRCGDLVVKSRRRQAQFAISSLAGKAQ